MLTDTSTPSPPKLPRPSGPTHLVFRDDRLLAEGSLAELVQTLHGLSAIARQGVLLFETDTGCEIDVDLRGSVSDLAARYPAAAINPKTPAHNGEIHAGVDDVPVPRKRGRPKLGVVGREITLLPRHWEWLDTQRGGASASLRRLIDQARKELAGEDAARAAQERTQRFLTTLAGNLPGFEDAIRALYARDQERFEHQLTGWPVDLRRTATQFAGDVCPLKTIAQRIEIRTTMVVHHALWITRSARRVV